MDIYDRDSPWESNSERLQSELLAASQMPEDEVWAIRPPLPQVVPNPPRYGYPSYQQRQPGIDGVLNLDRLYDDARNSFSGAEGSYSGSLRNVNSPGFG